MKPHESPRINKKSIRGNSGDSWPVWNRGIRGLTCSLNKTERILHSTKMSFSIIWFQIKHVNLFKSRVNIHFFNLNFICV